MTKVSLCATIIVQRKKPLRSIVYCRSGDIKPVIIGRDEDLKLIPIADQTAKKASKEWATTPLFLQRRTMNKQIIPFKTRVKDELIINAKKYRGYYLQYDYLVCSQAFQKNTYYIIQAHENNFLHLTGVNTSLSSQQFFQKCELGSLTELDFDFQRSGKEEKEVIGSVRRKIKALPAIFGLFNSETLVEEDFQKNQISCSFAAADSVCTLGFSISSTVKPKSLLKGNELNQNKAKNLSLVLRGIHGTKQFEEIILGNQKQLNIYAKSIKQYLMEPLLALLDEE